VEEQKVLCTENVPSYEGVHVLDIFFYLISYWFAYSLMTSGYPEYEHSIPHLHIAEYLPYNTGSHFTEW